jgi:hypothetical protein
VDDQKGTDEDLELRRFGELLKVKVEIRPKQIEK